MSASPTAAQIRFNAGLTATDPQSHPTLIVGQLRHLATLPFDSVSAKLQPRVNGETWQRAVASLHPAPTDFCPLYLNVATVAALPVNISRHNSSSRGHALTRIVRTHSFTVTETVVVVCERADLYASACAVARAFPLYSRKSSAKGGVTAGDGDVVSGLAGQQPPQQQPPIINVEFVLLEAGGTVCSGEAARLSTADLGTLHDAAHGIRLAARIVDAPCNEMHVGQFVNEIRTVAASLAEYGVAAPLVIEGEDLRKNGFGGIYGVGVAADNGPALVVLSHVVEAATETVAWVGKGIVYDTGGLSLKGKTAMPGMKRDCGGAAAVLGAFYAAVRAGFGQTLHAVFCLAENAVGPLATRPDDIHRLYSGRTVEINNTDAEGRLVLSDGVAYAKRDLQATIILDMATLTGAQGVATGKYHGAIMTNTDAWEDHAVRAGRASGDLLAPLVYCPELHFSEFASAVADMKNSVADRNNALASCAGLFIGANLGFDYAGVWVHVDMAYPVHCGERATGYGVALLGSLFGRYTKSEMLQAIAPNITAK